MDSLRPTRLILSLVILGGLLFASTATADTSNTLHFKYEHPASITGSVYDKTTTNLLFTFKRNATRSGSRLNVLREFTSPDGKIAARETLVYEGDQLISLRLEESQFGGQGGATITYDKSKSNTGKIQFEYQPADGKRQTASERLRPELLTGDMVGPFLRDHWDDLANDKKVECRYLVIPRKETVGFSFTKRAETEWRGKPAVIIRMEATSWLIAKMTNPLDFVVEKDAPHRVLQYTGRTTPKLKVKNDWQDLDAVTLFDWPTRTN